MFCISHATRDDLCNELPWLNPQRVFVTHLAADKVFRPVREPDALKAVRRKYGIPEGRYLLTLGSLQPRKGMEHAIKAFRELAAASPSFDLNLVIAGPRGWKDNAIIAAATADPTLAGRVRLTGRVEEEDLSALYSGAAAFVFASLYEGFGLPVLEAMQCGTPVISANTTSLPEVVGAAGLLVAPRDLDALCGAILEIANSDTRASELSRAAIARAREFSWARCAEETIAGYKAALS